MPIVDRSRSRSRPLGRLVIVVLASLAGIGVPVAQASESPTSAVTTVTLSRVNDAQCKTAPVTFGQPFRPGDVPRGTHLQATYKGQALPTQMDVKARNADGSVRHAVITIDGPCSDSARVTLERTAADQKGAPVTVADVLKSGFDAQFVASQPEHQWAGDARALLQQVSHAGGCNADGLYCRQWLSGPLVSEWIVGAPLQDAQGHTNPHLMAYFAVRVYGPAPVKRVRVDVIAENNWAYVDDPQNISYDAHITVSGTRGYDKKDLTHYRQARWHHALWWGASDAEPLYVAIDPAYIQSTPALPTYQAITIDPRLAAKASQECSPMDSCDISKHMEMTGAQAQIGPLPRWSSAYVIDTNYQLYRWMLANSDALGAYDVHYRERDTGEPLSLAAHPCATTLWPARQEKCQAPPHGDDRFPPCSHDCSSPLHPDEAHHPAPSYVAYLASGDWYYEQELMFWADWVVFWQNPAYRGYAEGLIHRSQLRGQAWALRSLSDAAYLLPDDAVLKSYFNDAVASNIVWYNNEYTDNRKANKLGAISNYHAVIYPFDGHDRVGIATWQQSFFTWAAGNLADQGFAGADRFRDWVSQFQIGQMITPGYCWEQASAYKIRIRDRQGAPFFDSFKIVYDRSFPSMAAAGCDAKAVNAVIRKKGSRGKFNYPPGTMVGYPKSGTGFVANFQVGLAAAATSDNPDARKAWSVFSHRNTKPDFSSSPQFGVVPSR